jgi:hypothetical protein
MPYTSPENEGAVPNTALLGQLVALSRNQQTLEQQLDQRSEELPSKKHTNKPPSLKCGNN